MAATEASHRATTASCRGLFLDFDHLLMLALGLDDGDLSVLLFGALFELGQNARLEFRVRGVADHLQEAGTLTVSFGEQQIHRFQGQFQCLGLEREREESQLVPQPR